MGKKGDLSDFERGMVVGARRASLSVFFTSVIISCAMLIMRWKHPLLCFC